MEVLELWRYPVKSLQGERLEAAFVTPDGIDGDRRFALYDVATGFGLTARREPQLLFASARLRDDGRPEITLPDGSIAADDAALSTWLGRPVELRSARADIALSYEDVVDFEHEPDSDWSAWEGPVGAFHDHADARLSLVSTATIADWDARRFRSNVLLDGGGEDELVGRRIPIGEATIDVGMRIKRCVMTTRAQPGGIARDLDVLRTIARERDARLAVGGLVAHAGLIRVGDRVV
ncbi:MAG TPA: MOSC N-terminal beta barrel domain-containing protein [Solirubrobacteraceae bacterium]|nr:MOSC N-terminal beta barrel domain-containing protein [Solirubrobacteraceae bacterium]